MTSSSPDIESLIAAARERHVKYLSSNPRCLFDDQPWPCPDRLLLVALDRVYEAARMLTSGRIDPTALSRLREALGEPNV